MVVMKMALTTSCTAWTLSWSGKWKPSATWSTLTWQSSTRPSVTWCRRPSCISWSTMWVISEHCYCLICHAETTGLWDLTDSVLCFSPSACRLKSSLMLSCWPSCTHVVTRTAWWRSLRSRPSTVTRCCGCTTLCGRLSKSSATSAHLLSPPPCHHPWTIRGFRCSVADLEDGKAHETSECGTERVRVGTGWGEQILKAHV